MVIACIPTYVFRYVIIILYLHIAKVAVGLYLTLAYSTYMDEKPPTEGASSNCNGGNTISASNVFTFTLL